MNRPFARLTHLVAAVTFVATPLASRAQDSGRVPSPKTAAMIAAGTLVVPVIYASASRNSQFDPLVAVSTLFAPLAGYAYGGVPERAFAPLGRRLIVLGVTAGTIRALCPPDRCSLFGDQGNFGFAAIVGLAGGTVFSVMTIGDIATIPSAVREHNKSRVAVAPAWIPSSRAVGLSMKVGF
jgi:hypothetical protein